MSVNIYLDESGCLGWKLDAKYLRGGSSRFFTLAALIVPQEKNHHIERPIRSLYKKRNRRTTNELKSVELNSAERVGIAEEMARLRSAHPDILFTAITVNKARVNQTFRRHPNALYNYMTNLLLHDYMCKFPRVCFIPDARSIKIEMKHTLAEYLITQLAASGAETVLETTPWESKESLSLQFADILAGLVWARYEFDNETKAYQKASSVLHHRQLFFES